MHLKWIYDKFHEQGLVTRTWYDQQLARAEEVLLYRQYYRGEHQFRLTREMQKMLRIESERAARFNANYSKLVVDTFKNRLIVDGVDLSVAGAETPDARGMLADMGLEASALDTLLERFRLVARDEGDQAWLDDLMEVNRLDALQSDIHKAVVRDGNTYLMSQYDDARQQVIWAHERAFDGDTGLIVVYDDKMRDIVAAAKVWHVFSGTRINLYYPDRIERYEAQYDDKGNLPDSAHLIGEPELTVREDRVPGVPVVHFYINPEEKHGVSVLRDVVPLQNTLNSTLVSMVMSSELAAFPVYFNKGFRMKNSLAPGAIIEAVLEDADGKLVVPEDADHARGVAAMLSAMSLERIQGASLVEYIRQAEFTIAQIGAISNTPLPQLMGGDSQSGEALKERQSALVAMVDEAHVHLGNAWEDAVRMAHTQHRLFGARRMPEITRISTQWKTSQARADGEIFQLVQMLNGMGYEREALRKLSLSSVADYTEEDIDRLMAEKRRDTEAALSSAVQGLPNFAGIEPLAV